jgi:hypothetical protein
MRTRENAKRGSIAPAAQEAASASSPSRAAPFAKPKAKLSPCSIPLGNFCAVVTPPRPVLNPMGPPSDKAQPPNPPKLDLWEYVYSPASKDRASAGNAGSAATASGGTSPAETTPVPSGQQYKIAVEALKLNYVSCPSPLFMSSCVQASCVCWSCF